MDVCQLFRFDSSTSTDCVLSNIWAPEKQKDVVSVRSDLPTALYLIDSIFRHWQNTTIFRPGYVVSCAPIILKKDPRIVTLVFCRQAGNCKQNADQ